MIHIPVLLKETLEYLDPQEGEVILDGTLGGGGHSSEICKLIGEKGTLIGIEQDKEILKETTEKLNQQGGCKKILLNGNFRDADELAQPLKIKNIDGALLDLGMNSEQIENSGRGFTFLKDEPLHMSYKIELSPDDLTAKDILNYWPEQDIYDILREYGEERYAKSISHNIVARRKDKKFETTFDLVKVIEESVPVIYTKKRIHFATRTFQALRIAVNDELNALVEGLNAIWDLLGEGGRFAVISFHSLEDRIVKNFFRDKKNAGEGDVLTKKPICAAEEEAIENPRSRSAKLRACLKI